jgi:hypothetical protein
MVIQANPISLSLRSPSRPHGKACGRIGERKSPPGRAWSGAGEVNPFQGSWGVWGTFITPLTSAGLWRFGDGGGPLTSNRIQVTVWRRRLLFSLLLSINVTARANGEVTEVTERRFSGKLMIRKEISMYRAAGPFAAGSAAQSALGRAHFYAGPRFNRLHDLGDILVGTEFVAGEFEDRGDRLDYLDRNAKRFGFCNKKAHIL